jgi:hypothetical protein
MTGTYMKTARIAIALLLGLCVAQSQAAIVIDVEDVWVPPGAGTAYVGVFAYTTTPLTPEAITGFNFPIDVGNDGNMLPSGFSLNAMPIQTVYSGGTMTFNTSQNALFNIDGIVNVSFATNVTLTSSASPIRLFDIVVNYGPAVLGGTSTPVIVDSDTANNGGLPFNRFTLSTSPSSATFSVVAGSINAIPEPGVLIPILATILSGGAMYFTRRRRS